MDYGIQRLSSDFRVVDLSLDALLDQAYYANIVASNYFQTQAYLFHAGCCRKDSLMCINKNKIYQLIEAWR